MKNLYLSVFCLLTLLSCTVDDNLEVRKGDPDIKVPATPSTDEQNASIDEKLFEVINLDYPGLESVKSFYEAGDKYNAAASLLEYYRTRTDVSNPGVNLLAANATQSEVNMANQATAEGGYRFYVRNYQEKDVDETTGLPLYWSFLGKDGSIDWEVVPEPCKGQTEWLAQKHRHQWMLPQAKAYRMTGDEKYAKAWVEIYGDWLDTYPCPEGKTNVVQWTGLQPAERAISQIDIMQYFIQSSHFTPSWLSTFLVAFAGHIECIRSNWYATESSNIRVAQEQAEVMAGMLMPEFKNAATWFEEGAAAISRQVKSQFNEDGVQNELDPSYHIGVVADFINIYKVAQLNNRLGAFPADYVSSLQKATRFVMDVIYPNYSIDNFNDTRSVSYTKSVLTRNLRNYSDMFPEDEALRWFATEGSGGTEPTTEIAVYDRSGWYMMRNGWKASSTMLVLKNNNNPDDKWHCQPDNGTIGLYRNGRRFLPDAGVYAYSGDSETIADRNAFRATKVHNTMTRNAADIKGGEHMMGQYLKHGVDGHAEYVVTQCHSYDDLTHRRAVFFVAKTFFVIVDEGYGTAVSPVDISFNLCATPNDVVIDDRFGSKAYGAYTMFPDKNNMIFKTFTETSDGWAPSNSTGYYSDAIMDKTQRRWYRVTIDKAADKAARFITVIYPANTENPDELAAMSAAINASFTDNLSGVPGTFHESGASVQVKFGKNTFNLSYSID